MALPPILLHQLRCGYFLHIFFRRVIGKMFHFHFLTFDKLRPLWRKTKVTLRQTSLSFKVYLLGRDSLGGDGDGRRGSVETTGGWGRFGALIRDVDVLLMFYYTGNLHDFGSHFFVEV